MEHESVGHETSTRREYLKYGGVVLGGVLVAGCSSQSGSDSTPTETATASTTNTTTTTTTTTTETSTETATATDTSTKAGTATDSTDGSYSVSIVPMGEVTFDSVPTKWLANNGSWADMGVALGHDLPKGVWLTDRYITRYYEKIPGVSVDKSGMIDLYSDGVSKEVFYDVGADVHVMDPNFILNRFKGLERADIERIGKNIAPFFGNTIFSRGYPWHDYRYYTLYEAFGKLAQVFQQQRRYEAFSKLHEEFKKTIEANLPNERPKVAILWGAGNKPEKFSPYQIDKGTGFKQWRDLKVNDEIAETDLKKYYVSRSKIDYEALLEIDPQVLLLRGHEQQTKQQFQNTVVEFMKNHPVASELQAVTNNKVFRGGPLYQGPIQNLVLTERAANQLYPDAFSGVQLYDPQRVSDIVNGDFQG